MQVHECGDGAKLTYDDMGQGELIVLLHGTPGTSRSWAKVAQKLAVTFRCVSPNLPGYGGSDPRPEGAPPRNDLLAERFEDLFATLERPPLLVGHSYGGNVALSLALRGNVALRGLVLFEPVALPALPVAGGDEVYARARGALGDYVEASQRDEPDAVSRMIDFWFSPGTFGAMPEPMRDYLRANSPKNVLDVLATFEERYTAEAFTALEIPVLVGYGSRSPLTLRRIAEAIVSLTDRGRLVEISGANHALTTTHVDCLVTLISGELRPS